MYSKLATKADALTLVVVKLSPKGYTNPELKQFKGKVDDAKEHVMKFVKTLGVIGLNDNLKLKEFSKSLIEKVYNWIVLIPLRKAHSKKESSFNSHNSQTHSEEMDKKFQNMKCEHNSRSNNRHAVAFITLASKIQIQVEDQSTISVLKRKLSCPSSELL
ncbi:H0502G05.11 protein [Theobroma cacao]|uniref:H0502G05.11 protein n=1 Tax=Theobroma cacao TaxID=3641 RepID=A0A061GZ73_THECC|nr:H0502G05.11 protein [Theobroma cacao]